MSGNDQRVLLTVIIPVYNEAATLLSLVERVRAVPIRLQVIIVDDCSTDNTKEQLLNLIDGVYEDVLVLYHQQNRGKGAAIRTAIPYISGKFVIIQDADLEYYPEEFENILSVFDNPEVDAVYGSRFLRGRPPMKLPNYVVNRLLAVMVRMLYGVRLTDEATCYKAFRSEVLQGIPLTCERFEFCPEVTAKLIKSKHKIAETAISYHPRTLAQGKKIRWTDGVEAIWTLIKWRFKT